MAVIIGGLTTVLVDAVGDGFQSVSWNINRQPNRLWELGSWTPWKTQVGATLSISITSYAGALAAMDLIPSTDCEKSTARKTIIINAQTCDGSPVVINEDYMYINSYSYSKGDPIGFGTESWSFQKWLESGVVGADFIQIPEPTYVLQGRAEGSRQGDIGNGNTDLGVQFLDEPGTWHVVEGQQGSVSAGFPGVGNADTIKLGLVDRIGGGKLEDGGKTGQSSATIPHSPLYIG
jgi:hypothetical protein